MAKTFESMEEHMQAPSGNKCGPSSRLNELGIALPAPPTPLGAYVESSDVGNLLFLSGMLPMVNRKLAVSGRFGENLSVKEGQEAARIASLNALAAAKHHLGDLDRLRAVVKDIGAILSRVMRKTTRRDAPPRRASFVTHGQSSETGPVFSVSARDCSLHLLPGES